MSDVSRDLSESTEDARRRFNDDREHMVPAKVQTFGLWLFLIGLSILFGSAMLVYVLIRARGQGMPEIGAFRAALSSPLLYLSTIVVILASIAIHQAVRQVRRERQAGFLRWLYITDALALLFIAIQTPAMILLLSRDLGQATEAGGIRETRLYGILFFYVLIHAAHVVGGMIYLGLLTYRARAGRYDHEHYTGVKHAAMYWHFLDVVWLLMFGTFLLLG